MTLCEKMAEVQTLLEMITTVWKEGKISGVRLVDHRKDLCVPNESSFPIPVEHIDIVRQSKTNLDNVDTLEESSVDDLCKIDKHRK